MSPDAWFLTAVNSKISTHPLFLIFISSQRTKYPRIANALTHEGLVTLNVQKCLNL